MSDFDYEVEVTEESWFSRLGNAIVGVLFGILLFLASFPLLFWNEGRAVKTAKSLKEASSAVVSVNPKKLDPANNQRLVHLSAKAIPSSISKDPLFGLKFNAIYVRRMVEMYQWEQSKSERTKKKLGGGTTKVTVYRYNRNWSEGRIRSEKFNNPEKYANPQPSYRAWSARAEKVHVGTYLLGTALANKLIRTRLLPLTDARKQQLAPAFKEKMKIVGDYLYSGDPAQPRLGDIRVQWFWLPATQVSVVAKQTQHRLEPYSTSNGRTVGLVRLGVFGPQAMIQRAQADNVTATWILRGLGIFLMFLGIFLFFNPLSVFADVVPIFGAIVGMGVFVVSLLLSFALSAATIGVAWVTYRPLVGIPLFVVSIVCLFLLVLSSRNQRRIPDEEEDPYYEG